MNRDRYWLCAPPLVLFLIDISLTLWGQPADYWAGNYQAAREGSPEVRRVMQIHPWLLSLLILAWMGVIIVLVTLLPTVLAEYFSAAVTIGHTIGASSWIWIHFRHSYQLNMALAIVSAGLLMTSVNAARRTTDTVTGWKCGPIGWVVIVGLLAVITYAVLLPHSAS